MKGNALFTAASLVASVEYFLYRLSHEKCAKMQAIYHWFIWTEKYYNRTGLNTATLGKTDYLYTRVFQKVRFPIFLPPKYLT